MPARAESTLFHGRPTDGHCTRPLFCRRRSCAYGAPWGPNGSKRRHGAAAALSAAPRSWPPLISRRLGIGYRSLEAKRDHTGRKTGAQTLVVEGALRRPPPAGASGTGRGTDSPCHSLLRGGFCHLFHQHAIVFAYPGHAGGDTNTVHSTLNLAGIQCKEYCEFFSHMLASLTPPPSSSREQQPRQSYQSVGRPSTTGRSETSCFAIILPWQSRPSAAGWLDIADEFKHGSGSKAKTQSVAGGPCCQPPWPAKPATPLQRSPTTITSCDAQCSSITHWRDCNPSYHPSYVQ